MNRTFLSLALSSLFTQQLIANTQSVASEVTADFARVNEAVETLAAKYGSESVLFVTDLDNTAVVLSGDMGSEHWFLWQKDLITNAPNARGTAARSVDELLAIQARLYALSSARPNEARIPADVSRWQGSGVKTIALTSRALDMRDHTVRELASIGLHLEASTAQLPNGLEYVPYDLNELDASGLDAEDVATLRLTTAKAILFDHGVLLTNGQNKGAMLRTFLRKAGLAPKAIVFIDDRPHHIAAVEQAFKATAAPDVEVIALQYIHAKPAIDAFNAKDKTDEIEQWCEIADFMRKVYHSGKEELPFRVCE